MQYMSLMAFNRYLAINKKFDHEGRGSRPLHIFND
jgi:hypothetical protein